MKTAMTVLGTLFLLSFLAFPGFAEAEWRDVLYLENGSVLRGVIVERVPGGVIKIRVAGGSVFSYRPEEIAKEGKEQVVSPSGPRGERRRGLGKAGMMSMLLPGLGQYRNGDVAEGMLVQVLYVGGLAVALTTGMEGEHLNEWFFIGMGVAVLMQVGSVVDAMTTEARRAEPVGRSATGIAGERYALNVGVVPGGVGLRAVIRF